MEKDRLINDIVAEAKARGADTDGFAEKLYIIMKDMIVEQMETQLALPNHGLNQKYINRFIAAKLVKGCTERTIAMYKTELTKILQKLRKPVVDISSDDIRLYLAVRMTQDGVSKVTANNELRYMRSFFGWLNDEELIPRNPTAKIDAIKQEKRKKKAFTEMECEKLRSACVTSMETAIIEVLLSTGCRVSELCGMRIDEIKDSKIVVKGKGNKYRTVYLTAKAQLALAKYLNDRNDMNPYIFPKSVPFFKGKGQRGRGCREWYKNPEAIADGKRNTSSVEATVRKIGKRAGVENTHPHRFRRTSATFALRRGMPLEMVSKMLGHENLATTQIYLDLTEEELEAAHKKYVI